MDTKQKTLEALEVFIQTQTTLLARTREDISRLNELRAQVAHSTASLDNWSSEDTPLRLSEYTGVAAEIQQEIDWSLFRGCDPVRLRTLSLEAAVSYTTRSRPDTTQCSPVSPLQQLVRDRRAELLDPFFSTYIPPSDDENSDGETNPKQVRKEQARAQLRALRHHRICEGSLTLPAGFAGVYVRRDTTDESADVAVDTDDGSTLPPAPSAEPMVTDSAPLPRSTRSLHAESQTRLKTSTSKRSALQADAAPGPDPSSRPTKRSSKQSETYKQAWTMSEQHLLERLLEEIPDGEKNRWAKISRAMEGKRTPRQVASRVQKYFEKLKRFGVDIPNRGDP